MNVVSPRGAGRGLGGGDGRGERHPARQIDKTMSWAATTLEREVGWEDQAYDAQGNLAHYVVHKFLECRSALTDLEWFLNLDLVN